MCEDIPPVYRHSLAANMKWSIILFSVAIAAIVAATEEELTSDVEPLHLIVARDTRGCDAGECTKSCRKMGYARGVCIGSYCQCRSRKRRSIPVIETQNIDPMPVVVEPETKHSIAARSTSRCNAESCTKHCRKLGYVRGVCIGSYCQCRALKKRSIPDPVPQIPERKHKIMARASCDPTDCNRFCIKLGHKRGVCVGYCQCRSV
ncbi:hypothetical protein evm_009923 [Chilo suppressalis]|nr:hypothetical protein evm_009923 [Chilo suppressalis]